MIIAVLGVILWNLLSKKSGPPSKTSFYLGSVIYHLLFIPWVLGYVHLFPNGIRWPQSFLEAAYWLLFPFPGTGGFDKCDGSDTDATASVDLDLDSLDIPDGRQSPFGTKRKEQERTKN